MCLCTGSGLKPQLQVKKVATTDSLRIPTAATKRRALGYNLGLKALGRLRAGRRCEKRSVTHANTALHTNENGSMGKYTRRMFSCYTCCNRIATEEMFP